MKKLLKMQDILLLGLSGVIDFLNESKDPFGLFERNKELGGWIPTRFRKSNYFQSVNHSLKTGYIEKVIKNGQPYLRLTSRGREKIKRDFSLVRFQNRKWDRKWRVVIFDIEEKKRNQRDILRKKLKELGLGMIQESVWVSPYDVAVDFREFIRSMGLGENVFVMEAEELLAGNQKQLAAKIWPLERLNSSYEELYRTLIKIHDRDKLSTIEGKGNGGNKAKNEIMKQSNETREQFIVAREKYLEILREDPSLPKELLPEDWFGEKVKNMLKRWS